MGNQRPEQLAREVVVVLRPDGVIAMEQLSKFHAKYDEHRRRDESEQNDGKRPNR
jgi:hypothetical protein